MRAIAGSIISAGSLIGLGFAAMGLGARYQNLAVSDPAKITFLKWTQLDTPMMLVIVVLLAALVVGLATTFLGLAYDHEDLCLHRHRLEDGSTASVVR